MAMIIDSIESINVMIRGLEDLMSSQVEVNGVVNGEALSMKGRTDEMKISTSEQKSASGEIVKSVSEINDLTQRNACGAQEISSSASNVARLAEKLKEGINFFRI